MRRLSVIFLILALLGAKKPCVGTRSVGADMSVPTIVLDAGHGGTDRGARAKAPFCEEKRLSLQTAQLAKTYLEKLGYHVVMTRNSDDLVSLSKRVEIARQASSSAFVSIHYNASKNPQAQGIEVFFCPSTEERIRAQSSQKLAKSVLSRVIWRTQATSRGVKTGNFYVIRETSMPAILVEGGFITNLAERKALREKEYIEKIARGVAEGVHSYFKARWKDKSSR